MTISDFDLCIIGGGINGTGIARDAAGRGLSVLLLEAQDLAGATSSASTKLIHGGLRYLEYYEFKLVREALKEREVLLNIAPHIIWPLNFVLPHDAHLRPAWMIRAGLFLYDHLAGRQKLKRSRGLNLRKHGYGKPLSDHYKRGFRYADCWVDDARLVVSNAIDAQAHGATILTRTACTGLTPKDKHWEIDVTNLTTNKTRRVTADKVVNAAGPWVHAILQDFGLATPETPHIRLVKGSHIIVPRLYDGKQCYILQQPDRRIIFAIPYEQDFTLIGTTDVDYEGSPAQVKISTDEITYLCDCINRSFDKKITPSDVVHTYSGVRPLFDDGDGNASAVTRDYKLVPNIINDAPILSVFGGKITTYRTLSEHAVNQLYKKKKPWTARAPLPGGDIPRADFDKFYKAQADKYPWLPEKLLHHYARHYGTRMDMIIGTATSLSDLGTHLGDYVYGAEIDYLVRHEWARTAEDILYRRTKLGLHISKDTAATIDEYTKLIVEKVVRT